MHACAQAKPEKFTIDYSLGTVSGVVGTDVVTMGSPSISVPDQALGVATNSTADFHSTSCDGVFVRSSLQNTLLAMWIDSVI